MLIKSLAGLIAAAALGLLAGCGTPCGPLGAGLCAPQPSKTSARQGPPPPAPVPGAVQPPPAPLAVPPPSAGRTTRIALLLPLNSDTLGPPARAIRDGFMAAWQHDRAGVEVDVVATGGTPQEALDAYTRAAGSDDIIVGPLARPAIELLAAHPLAKPTIPLSHPLEGTLPRQMLPVGLSSEDEASQVARWAAGDFPDGRALIVAGPAAWQQRIAKAFETAWSDLGRFSQRFDLSVAAGKVDAGTLEQLGIRAQVDRPEMLFAALDPGELRQVRAALALDIPCYGTSSINPAGEPGAGAAELNGIRLVDLPWEVQRDQASVLAYPRWGEAGQSPDMDRLYALGIDAFRVARQLAQRPDAPFTLDGVTGLLTINFGNPTASFTRKEAAVIYQDGAFRAAPGAP